MICFLDSCHEGEPVCCPGSCKCGPMDGVVTVIPLTVYVLTYGLDECPGSLSRLEGIFMGLCTTCM